MSGMLPKILVVDACILFSFFNKDSARRRLMEELPYFGCRLIMPEVAFRELLRGKERIKKYGRIDELEFTFLFSLLERRIEPFAEESYKEFLPEANRLSPHGEGTKDDPYFALALVFNCPVWSDESAFKRQDKIKVFGTKELTGLFRL